MPKWPVFSKRNVANIFYEKIRAKSGPAVWLNANVVDIPLENAQVRGVVAKAGNGNSLRVNAPVVVLAAGAIESTRLLLLMNQNNENKVFPPESPLGLGFHDHLSTRIANLAPIDRREIIRLFSFHFVQGGMRNLRYELLPEARSRHRMPAAFFHVAFSRPKGGSFEALRNVYQAIQDRSRPALSDLAKIALDAPWFSSAIWWRYAERRVLPPSNTTFEIHLVTEQAPDSRNSITLSESKKDAFGLPLARIDWQVRDVDREAFRRIARLTLSDWQKGPLSSIASPIPRNEVEMLGDLTKGGGIYHPAGTTRIGLDAKSGVLDKELRVHGVPGLWVISTSAFPSIGGSSPSLALLQFGLKAADDIISQTLALR